MKVNMKEQMFKVNLKGSVKVHQVDTRRKECTSGRGTCMGRGTEERKGK